MAFNVLDDDGSLEGGGGAKSKFGFMLGEISVGGRAVGVWTDGDSILFNTGNGCDGTESLGLIISSRLPLSGRGGGRCRVRLFRCSRFREGECAGCPLSRENRSFQDGDSIALRKLDVRIGATTEGFLSSCPTGDDGGNSLGGGPKSKLISDVSIGGGLRAGRPCTSYDRRRVGLGGDVLCVFFLESIEGGVIGGDQSGGGVSGGP